jgi:tRNA pseudouridine55 synthase
MLSDGLLIVDKPAGWTSSDVVGYVRKRARVKRVGHAGTLDPAATGVLPLALGQSTRLLEYLSDATKSYVAEITLGVTTNTYDTDGEVLSTNDASGVNIADVETALKQFRGEIDQVPPAFSALKRNGVPLYKLARRGEIVEVEPRRVRIDRLELLGFEPPVLRLEIDCSKGFYVRSLAHDLGAVLGAGGMLSGLQRTRVGGFELEHAVSLETFTGELEDGGWTERLIAGDEVLLNWQAAILAQDQASRLTHGLSIDLEDAAAKPAERCRAYTEEGDFLAVLQRVDSLTWRPAKVFGTVQAPSGA